MGYFRFFLEEKLGRRLQLSAEPVLSQEPEELS